MTKKLMGLFASVALMSSGMAFAHSDKADKNQQTQTQSGTGGAGTQGTGQSGSMQGTDTGGSGTQTGSGSQVGSGTGTGSGSQVGSGAQGGMGQQGGQAGQSGTLGQSGQSGTLGQSGTADPLSGNQITGRVVKSDRKTIWVEHAGAIVPLKIDKNTQFTDANLKRATDIKEGDQIRASFEVRKTDNVVTSIGMSSDMGQGGSGLESGSDVLSPDQGINQPSDSLPPSPGTGGSGSEDLGGSINEGTSPDSSLDTAGDAGTDKNTRTGDY